MVVTANAVDDLLPIENMGVEQLAASTSPRAPLKKISVCHHLG